MTFVLARALVHQQHQTATIQMRDSASRLLKNLRLLLAVILSSCALAHAQDHYRLDPATSEVHFTLGASGHDVVGTFHTSGGDFNFNRTSGAMSGKIAVDATSGNSDSKSRDKKMTTDQ